jgi:hypothetical protein
LSIAAASSADTIPQFSASTMSSCGIFEAGTESAFGLAGKKRKKEEVSTRRLSATGVQLVRGRAVTRSGFDALFPRTRQFSAARFRDHD